MISDSNQSGIMTGRLTDLIRQLQYNVLSKKSKNVDVLHISAEVSHKFLYQPVNDFVTQKNLPASASDSDH